MLYDRGMPKHNRHNLSLRNSDKLLALKTWMERDLPLRLTLSQVADAAIEILHKVALGTTSMIVHIPTFEQGVKALVLRATVQATGRIIAGFGIDVDIKTTPDGKIVATRPVDGKSVTENVAEAIAEEQVRQVAQQAQEGRASSLRVN